MNPISSISLRHVETDKIKFGIVLATYNPDLMFFEQQVTSILKQTHQNWHCWVVDDVSTVEKKTKIQDILKDQRKFTFIDSQENLGVKFNFERGFKSVDPTVNIVACCDQDDIWKINKLRRIAEVFKQTECILAHSDLELIDSENRILADSCWHSEKRSLNGDLAQLCLRNNVTGCSMAFLPELLEFALPFPNDSKKSPAYLHDHWLAVCAKLSGRMANIEEPLVLYRQHSANVVGAHGKSGEPGSLVAKSYKAWQSRKKLLEDLVQRAQERNLESIELKQIERKFSSIMASSKLILENKNKFSLRLLAQRWLAEFRR